MVSLSSTAQLVRAIGRAHSITFSAYILSPGQVLDALRAAGERGARVVVRLAGATFRDDAGATINSQAAARLRAAGADVKLCDESHLKAAVVDGCAFLDDRNWPIAGADTVVRDDRAGDVWMLRKAIVGGVVGSSRRLTTDKDAALAQEERLLASARPGEDVIVQTESFGYGKEIYPMLARLARGGRHVRLLVAKRDMRQSQRERSAIARLERLGVEVRTSESNEKFALCGRHGWVGSANATYAYPGERDWGLRTDDPQIVDHLRDAFESRWAKAHRAG